MCWWNSLTWQHLIILSSIAITFQLAWKIKINSEGRFNNKLKHEPTRPIKVAISRTKRHRFPCGGEKMEGGKIMIHRWCSCVWIVYGVLMSCGLSHHERKYFILLPCLTAKSKRRSTFVSSFFFKKEQNKLIFFVHI